MNYELTDDQAQTLASEQPELMVNINIGINDMLNNCYYKRDGEASVSSRIVGGAPALPGAVIKWGCVFPMVISSDFLIVRQGHDDHQEDASHFRI